MCGAVLDKRLHTVPSLGNVFVIQFPEIHNVTPQLNNFSRGIILPYKSIFYLFQESIVFLGRDCSHSLALPLKEKGKSFSLTMSPPTSLYFCMSQSSIKLFRCKAASSPAPEN